MEKANLTYSVLASAVRAAANNSDDQLNQFARGASIVIDITAVPGVDTVTFTIQGKDPTSGKYYTILASPALSATGTLVLRIFPGLVAAANATVNDVLPRAWRVSVAHSAGSNFTYSVGASLQL